jgi:hypothetical protein
MLVAGRLDLHVTVTIPDFGSKGCDAESSAMTPAGCGRSSNRSRREHGRPFDEDMELDFAYSLAGGPLSRQRLQQAAR